MRSACLVDVSNADAAQLRVAREQAVFQLAPHRLEIGGDQNRY